MAQFELFDAFCATSPLIAILADSIDNWQPQNRYESSWRIESLR